MSSRAVALLEGPLLGEGSAEGGVLQEVMASGVLLEGEASAEPSLSHAPAARTALCRALSRGLSSTGLLLELVLQTPLPALS